MQLGTALNLPNPRINFGGTGRAPGKGNTAIFSFETGVLDSRINFSRTTNATVTNSAGQITYAPHNLLLASEQFDNAAWAKTNSTISANATTAPDGTTTADKLVLNSSPATTHLIATAITQNAVTYTFSIYAKAAELTQIFLNNGATSTGAFFNLATGTTSNVGAGITAVITPANNGYYRCSISYLSTAASVSNRCYLAQSDLITFATADGTSGVYIWGAQLEIGSTATTYNSTTVKNLLGYSELFDNAAWTKSNSFVQTNLINYSEDFSNALWQKPSVTVTANSEIAPNGYQTADTLTATAGAALIQNSATSVVGVSYTVSIWVKRKTGTGAIYLRSVEPGNNLINVTNEWQRFSITTTATSTILRVGIVINTSGDEVYVWGAQAVQGSEAGDYRRTDAAALPVYYPNHNGVVCAEKLVESTATALHYPNQVVSGGTAGTYVLSVYAKAAERTWVSLQCAGTAVFPSAYFDLLTGTVGTSDFSAVGSIVSVGNGYYRCALKFTTDKAPDCRIYIATANGTRSYTGDGTSGIYIFGAQLSDSASLDPYVLNAGAAPTAAAYYGARFDYDPVTLAPKGLLIEEQRANLRLYSEDFRNTADAGATRPTFYANATVTNVATNNPYGVSGTYKVVEDTANAEHLIFFSTVLTAAAYSNSIYLKADTRSKVRVALATAGLAYGASVIADLSAGTLSAITQYGGHTGATASIEARANGWYRVVINITGTANTFVSSLTLVTGTSTTSYTGDGTSGIYIWGAQLEAGAFATSYIPTAASQVTRAADVATIQGSNLISWLNINEGTISSSLISNNLNANARFLYMTSDLTTSNSRLFDIYLGSSTRIDAVSVTNASVVVNQTITPSPSLTANSTIKVAYGYAQNNTNFAANNTVATTDTVCILPYGNFTFYLGALGLTSASNFLNGTIKQISYYPQRLSNDVLKGLTA